MTDNSKRQFTFNSDMTNNEIIHSKKKKLVENKDKNFYTLGQIKELHMLNFMCYKSFSIQFHPTHMQIVTGANGSGKSTIANAICLCLGAQARATGRTSNVQSFIRKGETSAELTITLANEGPEAFRPELYGKEIRIIRRIGSRQSGYKMLDANNQKIRTHKETIDEIIQALSISPENPLCILHQEIAKTFLTNSDSKRKYQFYMKVSQLDQIKQAYEQGICTIHLLTKRVDAMKEKHFDMLRELDRLEQEVKKIEIRRDYEEKRHGLENELNIARGDQARQELFEVQYELEQIQKTKDNNENEINQLNNQIIEINRNLDNYSTDKLDIEKDTNGLRELLTNFSKQKQNIQFNIYSLTQNCDEYREILTDIELKQIYLQKQIDNYEKQTQQIADSDQQDEIEDEISLRQNKQIEWDKLVISLNDDMHINEENIQNKQTMINFLENELKQKQEDLQQFNKIDQDRINIYGLWMNDCLKAIQNDQRFHQIPIGPIGRYIHCINSYWSYAVEKHLAPIMSSFICSDNEDEQILLEILSSYSSDHRPPVYVRTYSDQVHDISGTLDYIKQADLLCIYDVLKIDNITVECALIDLKQIEATILIENLEEAKQIRQNGKLNWKKIDKKVKQVVEAWTVDGSNIKFDKTFRIYTNEKQVMKYFLTNSTQLLSMKELELSIKTLNEQIIQMKELMNQLVIVRQTILEEINQAKKTTTNNKKKINELNKKLDQLQSTMPNIMDCSLDELQEKADSYLATYTNAIRQYDETKTKKEENIQQLDDITEDYENLSKKYDLKIQQYDLIVEKIHNEQSKYFKIEQQIQKLIKKSLHLNEMILNYKDKLKQLTKKRSRKAKKTKPIVRSIRSIQQELDAINNYLQANQDTNEERREVINNYRTKRDITKEYKQTYERCYQQIEHLQQFIYKRQEGFLTIADQHLYFLRSKFQNLMKNYNFDDSDIEIDHKNEELQIIIRKSQRNLSSLSGGERSISTLCFLLALWESIYQPFRLLDEIDIHMDNETFNSSLDILYENTSNYSSSQHIIFTPQAIDSQFWNDLNVPVFYMPNPKRSF